MAFIIRAIKLPQAQNSHCGSCQSIISTDQPLWVLSVYQQHRPATVGPVSLSATQTSHSGSCQPIISTGQPLWVLSVSHQHRPATVGPVSLSSAPTSHCGSCQSIISTDQPLWVLSDHHKHRPAADTFHSVSIPPPSYFDLNKVYCKAKLKSNVDDPVHSPFGRPSSADRKLCRPHLCTSFTHQQCYIRGYFRRMAWVTD